MPALEKYGLDYETNFTEHDTFRGKKRWSKEIEHLEAEMKKSDGKYVAETSNAARGSVTIMINEIADGSLKKSISDSDYPIVMNIEVSERYPMEPPFVWIQSPVLAYNSTFGVFNGVPCIRELKLDGWSPIWNLTSVFQFVLNAIVEHAQIDKSRRGSQIQRKDAIQGSKRITDAHRDWNK